MGFALSNFTSILYKYKKYTNIQICTLKYTHIPLRGIVPPCLLFQILHQSYTNIKNIQIYKYTNMHTQIYTHSPKGDCSPLFALSNFTSILYKYKKYTNIQIYKYTNMHTQIYTHSPKGDCSPLFALSN